MRFPSPLAALVLSILLALPLLVAGQKDQEVELIDEQSGFRVYMIKVNVGYDIPGGDLADRFGNNYEVGGGFLYKSKTNWLVGFDANFLTGDRVYESKLVEDLLVAEGQLVGLNGLYSEVKLTERGFKVPILKVGRVFPLPLAGSNEASGLYVMAGAGYMQHKIRIDDRQKALPSLSGDYAKGYDRLSTGLALVENIGYLYLSENRLINFFFSLEFTQGFTKNRRGFNFDTRSYDNESRTDLLWGVQMGWIFTIYNQPKEKYYYF